MLWQWIWIIQTLVSHTKKKNKKKRGSLQILHSAYKNGGFKTLCRDSVCLCYATLPFFVGYYQSK